MAGDDEMEPNWQQFRGTELGGLLQTIYGQPRPAINYPKPKTKAFQPDGKFKSSGAAPIVATRRNVTVAVPRVGGAAASSSSRTRDDDRPRPAPVDCIARRKQVDRIKAEQDEFKIQQTFYRGPMVREMGEREKDRCAQIFGFKGGKALPDELTCPAGDAPFELAEKRRERERVEKVMERRNPAKYAAMRQPTAPMLSEVEQLKEQIVSEINERRSYLEDMRSQHLTTQNDVKIRGEISQRIAELHKLENEERR